MSLQNSEDQPAQSVFLSAGTHPMPNGSLRISSATQPPVGQKNGGDHCSWWSTPTRLIMAVADGLGQGPEVVKAAMACIGTSLEHSLDEMFATLDAQLRDTHGIALAVVIVEIDSLSMSIASVGNIRTVLLRESGEYPMSNTSGIVGAGYDQLLSETRILSPGDVLALYADGLDAYFALRETLEIAALSSLNMARTVLDRWARVGEVAAILICRHET